jgi:hypothetical protein
VGKIDGLTTAATALGGPSPRKRKIVFGKFRDNP